jgi:VanZ family protein
MSYAYWWKLVGGSLVAPIAYLSLTPSPIEPVFPESDKLAHGLAYFALAAWYCQLYGRPYHARVVLAAAALGVVIEILQAGTSYRSFEVADILADLIGVGLAVVVSTQTRASLLTRIDRRLALWVQAHRG